MLPVARMILLATAVSLLGACGGSDDSREAREKKAEDYARSKGVDADVRIAADGSSSVTINQSLGTTSAQTGNDLAIPEDFPRDVAVYPGLQILSSARMPVGQVLQGLTADDRDSVIAYYAKAMVENGWTDVTNSGAQIPAMHNLRFTKGQRMVTVGLMQAGAKINVQMALTTTG